MNYKFKHHVNALASLKLDLVISRLSLELFSIHPSIHSSIICNHFIPFMGSWGLLLEPVPAVSGRGQGTPWKSHQLITGHLLMAEATMQGVNCTSRLIWGSVSCSKTLRHAAQLSRELGFEPATFRSLADLLYPLSTAVPLNCFTMYLILLNTLSYNLWNCYCSILLNCTPVNCWGVLGWSCVMYCNTS